MEYFRKYLIMIRREDNKVDLKPALSIRLLIVSMFGVVIGVLLDVLLPFNFFTNMIRGLIANIVGLSSASYLFLMATKIRKERIKKDQYYKPIRKRFSYRQRVNFSIMIGGITSLFVLLSGKPSAIYTLKAAISIQVVLTLIAFSRRDRSEFLKNIYEIPDIRDLEFMSKNNMKNKEEEKTIDKRVRERKDK